MTLKQRLDTTRISCETALESPLVGDAIEFLRNRSVGGGTMLEMLVTVANTQSVPAELSMLEKEFTARHPDAVQASAFERALLVNAALAAVNAIPNLRLDESVKHLFCKEFLSYANPPSGSLARFSIEQYPFVAMSKIVTLRRFPAGPTHWDVSGLPRSWFARTSVTRLPKLLWFTYTRMKGRKPYFVAHLGGTVARLPMLTQREFLKAFCRVAIAVELQPEIKGVLAGSWLHSQETHRVSPHLAFMNRPFLECGGHYFDAGPATESDGFLAGDGGRAELYRSGKYKPTFGVVMCSREQMIAWRRNHPGVESQLAVR